MKIAALAIKSFRNRKFGAALAIVSIALSVSLLLGVEILREQARTGFTNTVSGTDLIVGSRSGSVNLLLYSVFRIGNPSNNIDWSSYAEISDLPQVKWSIPLTMGDSHRGFRVLGTDRNYIDHFRYGRARNLELRHGAWFEHDDETVLGAAVASSLGYRLGDEIVVAHGAGDESFITHDEQPFRVVGILAPTGTPVDRALHVSLDGFDRMHSDWRHGGDAHDHDPLAGMLAGARSTGESGRSDSLHTDDALATDTAHEGHDEHEEHEEHEGHEGHDEPEVHQQHARPEQPEYTGDRSISAFLLGLESRAAAIGLQRKINDFEHEPLSAILPGVALLELWEIVGLVENTLLAISIMVVVVGLFSMLIILLTSINERRREMAILRAMGASPGQILALIIGEAAFLTLAGIGLGMLLVSALVLAGQGLIAQQFGLFIELNLFSPRQVNIVLLVAVFGCLIGLIPGIRIYRYSLLDGMTVRV